MRSEQLVSGRQIKAARALLECTRVDLARAAKLHPNSVAYWESQDVIRTASQQVGCLKIVAALKERGCTFVGGALPGVRYCASQPISSVPRVHARASWGVTKVREQSNPRNNRNCRCGAKTRTGTPCRRRALINGRCRNHGGCSTGPKSPEGREAIAEGQRRRWQVWRDRDRTGE